MVTAYRLKMARATLTHINRGRFCLNHLPVLRDIFAEGGSTQDKVAFNRLLAQAEATGHRFPADLFPDPVLPIAIH